MVNILLVDALSIQHVGNAALVDSTLVQLSVYFPEAQFTILAFDPISIAGFCNCRAIETLWADSIFVGSKLDLAKRVARESLWMLINAFNFSILRKLHLYIDPSKYTRSLKKLAALKAYSDADIVVSISGEALQDDGWRRVPFFLYGYWLAHKMGKIVAIFPQSIGPLEKRSLGFIVRYVLNRCDLVFPRDLISLGTIERLWIRPEKVHLVPDVVTNQSYVSAGEAIQLLLDAGVDIARRPLIGMAISNLKEQDFLKYFATMKELCRFITIDFNGTVVLFSPNMPFRQEISDFEMAQALYQELPNKENVVLLSRTYTPREFKGMQGQLDLFITTRMHAAILATMIGTPTITINTQPKLRGYMQMIHQEARACEVKDFSVEGAKHLIVDTLSEANQIRENLQSTRDGVGKRAMEASRLLREVYDQRIIDELRP